MQVVMAVMAVMVVMVVLMVRVVLLKETMAMEEQAVTVALGELDQRMDVTEKPDSLEAIIIGMHDSFN